MSRKGKREQQKPVSFDELIELSRRIYPQYYDLPEPPLEALGLRWEEVVVVEEKEEREEKPAPPKTFRFRTVSVMERTRDALRFLAILMGKHVYEVVDSLVLDYLHRHRMDIEESLGEVLRKR